MINLKNKQFIIYLFIYFVYKFNYIEYLRYLILINVNSIIELHDRIKILNKYLNLIITYI